MPESDVVRIHASVGRYGINNRFDVLAVQALLNANVLAPLRPLDVDGILGPLTIRAIEEAERRYIRARDPDGRLDPFGPTLRAMNHRPRTIPARRVMPPVPPPTPAARSASPARRAAPTKPASAAEPHSAARAASRIPAEVIAAAQASQRRWNVPASITIAQWSLESGWGKRMPPGSNNPFGIKAVAGQPSVRARTREEHKDGSSYYVIAAFRKFPSLADAFAEHGRLLAVHPAYKKARSHVTDPDRYADALTGTYATAHGYGKMLKDQMHHYDMYQYDR